MIDLMFEDGWHRIGTIAIDCVVREVHRLAGEVTTHPVEDGSDMVDHYRPAPRAVQLEGIVTDTPIGLPGSHHNDARLVQQTFEIPNELFGMRLGPIPVSIKGTPGQGAVTTFSAPMERVRSTWEEFENIFLQRRLVTIVTSLRSYPDMALADLEVDRRPGSYKFSCFATQVRKVVSGRSAAVTLPAVKRAVPKVDKGKQQPAPAPTVDRSAAVQTYQRLGPSISFLTGGQ